MSDVKLKDNKNKALNKAQKEYYDKNSKHYRDNERYSWAIKTINEHYANKK